METTLAAEPRQAVATEKERPQVRRWWRAAAPLAVITIIALIPAPAGLARHAWYYFAVFAGVIAALVVEPLPSPALGVVGVTLAAVLSRGGLFSPAGLTQPGVALPPPSLQSAPPRSPPAPPP